MFWNYFTNKYTTHTQIPVYIGAGRALIEPTGTEPFNGHDGLGDVPVVNNASSTIDRRPLRPEHAVNALHRIVCLEHEPHSVTLVCCAPLTNLALAIRMYGTAFLRRCRDIYMMGGNYNAVGNMPQRCCAEYNFFADPEAAKIVLEACAEAGVPVTVLPWEACTRRTLPGLDVSWRFDVLGGTKQQQQQHPILRWMEPLERSIWGKCAAGDTYNVCDAFLVGCLLFPGRLVRRQKRRKCTVELEGRHTRGQMVVDHVNGSSSGENENEEATRNVTVIELLDVEACKALLLWTVDALDDADWAAEERAKSS